MSEGDGAAVDVDLVPVPALVGQGVSVGKDLGGKGFVQFDQIHVAQRPADLFQKLGDGIGRRGK